MSLQNGDILHFKAKGVQRFKSGFNRIRTAIYLDIENEPMVAIYVDGTIGLVTLYNFSNCYDYITSRPEWKSNPINEVLSRIGRKFKNEHVLFAEIIGISDFSKCKQDDILHLCIERRWLQ